MDKRVSCPVEHIFTVPPKIHVEVKGVGSVNWSEGSGVQTKEFKASEVYVDLKVPLENKFRGWRVLLPNASK